MYPIWNKDKIVYRLNQEVLRIGSDDDDSKEIVGNIDIWEDIIRHLTGKNSLNDIKKYLENKYNINSESCDAFIEGFYQNNFIDLLDKEYDDEDPFNIYFESLRTYYSSSGYGGIKFLEKLQSMKFTILGCGSGGSHLAYFLAQSGVGNIHIVDPDKVTLNNVNRQALFKMSDVDKYKVDTLKESLKEKNPYVNITSNIKRMVTVDDVKKEIINSDFVICAMDEPPYIAQRLVNKACYDLNIPSVYAFSQKSAGKMFMVYPNETPCADCLLSKYDEEEFINLVKIFLSSSQDLITANTASNTALLTSWIVNKIIDSIAQKNIDGGILYRYDFHIFEEKEFDEFEENDECPTCSNTCDKLDSELFNILRIN